MKRLVFFLFFVLLGLSACGDGGSASGRGGSTDPIFRSVSPKDAAALIASRKDLELIDVRSPEELREGSIAGSRLVPFTDIARGRVNLPKDRPLLLICAVGGRSYMVGRYFSQNGYPEIYNLEGGISAWKAAGLPLR